MSVKVTLIEMMRREGYDFFTAAEHATKALEEFRASEKEEVTLTCGASSVTIRKRDTSKRCEPPSKLTSDGSLAINNTAIGDA